MGRFTERFTIAVVDDDRPMLAYLCDVLSGAGFTVRGYRTGEKALNAHWDVPVNLLVTDVLLPKMSGLDLARELRGRPAMKALPVVAVSGLQWSNEQRAAIADGLIPGRLLPKPVEPNELLVIVTRLLAATVHAHGDEIPVELEVDEVPTAAELGVNPDSESTVRIEVNLQTAREILDEYTQNLSHDGLFVRCLQPLAGESVVSVALRVPFRAQAVIVAGMVVRSVPPTSSEARTHGPGMSIALLDLPKDFKRELYAYVSGLRAGAGLNAPAERRIRSLLVIGMEDRLPRETTSFLRRTDVHAQWVPSYEAALVVLTRHPQPWSVVLNGRELGPTPEQRIGDLERLGAEWIAVLDDTRFGYDLGDRVHLLDGRLAPNPLLDRISESLSYPPRASARVPCQTELRGTRVDGALTGKVENLSLGGLLMVTEAPCAVGERIRVQFELPDGAGKVSGSISAVRVTRARNDSNEVAIAASFDRIDEDSVEVLRRFLEAKVGPEAYRRMLQLERAGSMLQ
jgi:DNA-binding response OmpR family regulator